MIGTTSPWGVSTATPTLTYFFRIRVSPFGPRELLNSGYFFSAPAAALTMNASGVSLTPSLAAASFWPLRKSSSSVMSA